MKRPITFEDAITNLEQAHATAHQAMQRDYPLEAIITYKVGMDLHVVATVIDHGIGLRVKVRGQNSGKEYWIDARRVTSVLSQSVK